MKRVGTVIAVLMMVMITKGNILDSLVTSFSAEYQAEVKEDNLGQYLGHIPHFKTRVSRGQPVGGVEVERVGSTYNNSIRDLRRLNQDTTRSHSRVVARQAVNFGRCDFELNPADEYFMVTNGHHGLSLDYLKLDIVGALAHIADPHAHGDGVAFLSLSEGLTECCCSNFFDHFEGFDVSPQVADEFLEFFWYHALSSVQNDETYFTPNFCSCRGEALRNYDYTFNVLPLKKARLTRLGLEVEASHEVIKGEDIVVVSAEVQNTGFEFTDTLVCSMGYDDSLVENMLEAQCYHEQCYCISDVGVVTCFFTDPLAPGERATLLTTLETRRQLFDQDRDTTPFSWICTAENADDVSQGAAAWDHPFVVRYYQPCEASSGDACECNDFVVNHDDKEMLAVDEEGQLFGCMSEGHLRNLCDVVDWIQESRVTFRSQSKRIELLEDLVEKQQSIINRLVRTLDDKK